MGARFIVFGIYHKQIHVRKQISIRCNRIEHWVHLRCAGIRQEQYTDTWICHLYRESRLTTHTHITPPFQTLVQTRYTLPTYSIAPFTPPQPKHRHTSNTLPVPTGLVNPKPNPLTHSHTPPTPLIYSTSAGLDTIHEPRVPPTRPALTTTTPHPSPTPALLSTSHPHTLSSYTHAIQTTVTYHRHSNHRIHIEYHDTPQTDQIRLQTQHKDTDPEIKSKINLIILQVNINGLKKTRGARTAFSRHTCRYHQTSGT